MTDDLKRVLQLSADRTHGFIESLASKVTGMSYDDERGLYDRAFAADYLLKADAEHFRTRAVVEAMIEAIECADRVLRDPVYTSQIALAAWEPALARLKSEVAKMEGE